MENGVDEEEREPKEGRKTKGQEKGRLQVKIKGSEKEEWIELEESRGEWRRVGGGGEEEATKSKRKEKKEDKKEQKREKKTKDRT
jgi:hypothetical protein